jgi:lipoate-protein ligase A
MAADEVLLESAVSGVASLRFYGWSQATLSLGYFQSHSLRGSDEVVGDLPYVRRPSGGDALVHHHEVTYALALPAGAAWRSDRPSNWLCRVHGTIGAALAELGVATSSCPSDPVERASRFLCFGHAVAGDRLIGTAKVVGSAQRRHRGAIMQHGAILLARSLHTPSLPGIRELTGKSLEPAILRDEIAAVLAREVGWQLSAGTWEPLEIDRIRFLGEAKYRQPAWNDKR